MYGYAQNIDLVQNGEISEIRMHGILGLHRGTASSKTYAAMPVDQVQRECVTSSCKAFRSCLATQPYAFAEDMQMWPMDEAYAADGKIGLSEEDLREGVFLS